MQYDVQYNYLYILPCSPLVPEMGTQFRLKSRLDLRLDSDSRFGNPKQSLFLSDELNVITFLIIVCDLMHPVRSAM